VVGLAESREQQAVAQERCKGLPVQIALMDYRNLEGNFDRIVSIGMFEQVGPKNYRRFFDTVEGAPKDQGLFLLHTIGLSDTTHSTNAWIDHYIFPNGKLPSARQVTTAFEPHFIFEDWHNFGQDFHLTLMAGWKHFDTAWCGLKDKYGERFYRMWKYYVHSCAEFFRSRQGQLWQLVLAKPSRRAVYRAPR
jgi:cyclopropane-fatty-acyl-phospholipid synthase